MIKIYPKLREQTYWHIELPFSIHVFLRKGGGQMRTRRRTEADKNRKKAQRKLGKTLLQACKEQGRCVCEMCGYGLGLTAHHVLPISLFPQYASDLNNVKVLCDDCHNKVHKDPFLDSRMQLATARLIGANLRDVYGDYVGA